VIQDAASAKDAGTTPLTVILSEAKDLMTVANGIPFEAA
jgi:hypothetical protein